MAGSIGLSVLMCSQWCGSLRDREPIRNCGALHEGMVCGWGQILVGAEAWEMSSKAVLSHAQMHECSGPMIKAWALWVIH